MMFLKKLLGTRNQRVLKSHTAFAAAVRSVSVSPEEDLVQRATALRGRPLDQIRTEAVALAAESARRSLALDPYDVQLIGASLLMSGHIAEMRTGEGKTLTAALAVCARALSGGSVHVVTVNDYLAARDAATLSPLYIGLGLSVGVIRPDMDRPARRAAYACDIVYATNNELGFDHLRDNMAASTTDRVQRGLGFALIDEVDSILIDEARTPLIISGPADQDATLFTAMHTAILRLTRGEPSADGRDGECDYTVDEKRRSVHLTEAGSARLESILQESGLLPDGMSLYAGDNLHLVYHANAALKATAVYRRDVHYLVRDGEALIVDEFTGRALPGRRWADGLHQAIEAKEGLVVQPESQTAATVTIQNFFRAYGTLAGMTGTADSEAFEFQDIYGLEVVVVPTHRPMVRQDHPDHVFLSEAVKFQHAADDAADCHARRQPVLIGTASIEMSERFSVELTRRGIPHNVLNAKNHASEAAIIAEAGLPGAVTIATNMAGRGTDIVLGGHPEPGDDWLDRHRQAVQAGGLHVIGTERHESRRIDNQLRGRAGRQGDPGSSRFYVSFEDHLIRIFAPQNAVRALTAMGLPADRALVSPMVSRQIEAAQKTVERHNFDARKSLLQYDDVMNAQRKAFYAHRDQLMAADDLEPFWLTAFGLAWASLVSHADIVLLELGDAMMRADLEKRLQAAWSMPIDASLSPDALHDRCFDRVAAAAQADPERSRAVLLRAMDQAWRDHLQRMDVLRKGIHLRSFAQKKPEQEYAQDAHGLFSSMVDLAAAEAVESLMRPPLPPPSQPLFDFNTPYQIRYKGPFVSLRVTRAILRLFPVPVSAAA